MLGMQLFKIFSKNLAEETKCYVSKFADDTKLRENAGREED